MNDFYYNVPDFSSGVLEIPSFGNPTKSVIIENVGEKEVMVWLDTTKPIPGNNRYNIPPFSWEAFIPRYRIIKVAAKGGEGKIKVKFE